MSEENEPEVSKETQVAQWLKKLERESWQLELLVSAFTIFLLIQANIAYEEFFSELGFRYNLNGDILAFIYFFFGLLGISIKALTIFLVLHLMLRGFWIGAIGLRSVQPTIDFAALNYSPQFTEKLKRKVRTLDDLVILLDQVCSVVFSFSFLIISMLIAFGLYLLFLGVLVFLLNLLNDVAGETVTGITGLVVILLTLLSGLIYLIDYFSLGFFKKLKWFGKIYSPIYHFYGIITFSGISRSIYYYLITKFSKKRIRWAYMVALAIWIFSFTMEFDQFQFFSDDSDRHYLSNNFYDDQRPEKNHIGVLSIESRVIAGDFMEIFIRSRASDNEVLRALCPDFEPPKNEGWNSTLNVSVDDGNVNVDTGGSSAGASEEQMMECLLQLYRLSVNDSTYTDLQAFFHEHPSKHQKGIFTMLSTKHFLPGANILKLEKRYMLSSNDSIYWAETAYVPFWYAPED